MEKYNLLVSVSSLLERYDELKPILTKYFEEQNLSSEVRHFLLNDLSILMLNDAYTIEIASTCSPILLDLLNRASDMTKDDSITKHEWLCICLSKLIWAYPDVDRFAKLYFEKSYGFFCRFDDDGEPPSKKNRSDMIVAPLHKLVKAANLLLIYDSQSFKELCDWSLLASFIHDSDVRTRWNAYQCLPRICNIKVSDLNVLLREKFTDEEFKICAIEEFESNKMFNFTQYRPFTYIMDTDKHALKLSNEDFSKEIVNVEGVLLYRNPYCEDDLDEEKFVYVPSVKKSLRHLAHAVSAGEPVLLQGPVGCGKTTLVEHLAAVSGRRPFEELLKIQLGDHMDSKMLLGTHCCTDVPGEFVWKSGILVQAMTEGHWLLLEDIDCAPMDVVSLLVPVLQSGTIVLPGHANPIKAAAGFQLFATQRLIRGFEGSYVEFRNNTSIIENQFRKILMDPLPKGELKKVICTKWHRLERMSDRILEVYSLFSSDLSDLSEDEAESSKEPFNLYNHHGRLVSTRDLFKFCGRIASHFDAPKKDNSITLFQNAIECYCDSIPLVETRVIAAESVAVKFHIPKPKASYFCKKDKPAIKKSEQEVSIGRVRLSRKSNILKIGSDRRTVFAHTRQASALLEKVAVAVLKKEPVLLVGETGTGKTSVVQYLADLTNRKLTVINMSQQSDSVDLIGGYKPVDLILAVRPVREMFNNLFPQSMDVQKNSKFLQHIANKFNKKQYDHMCELMLHAQGEVLKRFKQKNDKSAQTLEQISAWKHLGEKLITLKQQIQQSKNTLIFKFIEGALVKAMKNGDWILLDEINLAEAETLECLAGVLEKENNTLFLLEKGDKEPVTRHPDFHIFACMNPATDIGKKDLPVGIRNRFTEFFVEEIEERIDLFILVQEYLKGLSLNNSVLGEIVDFYMYIRKVSFDKLSDGAGHYPHYSLRTLCRALKYASTNPCHNVPRSLYEAFCLSFLSQLDSASHSFVMSAITNKILGKNHSSVLKQSIPEPSNGKYHFISSYWIRSGSLEPHTPAKYIFSNTVLRNLKDLSRIVSASRYPVLLQGETSVGKTSLVQWLAKASGNVCVRVNNHEHTDIQEYVGTYSADEDGKLVFKDGILVEAMRNGYWIILDELNLAPTEVMEALNRVLDDNRELFIPETQTVVKAHPGFMIFATQNPPGSYGGRKLLSRAFRNRFIELHFNEIPPEELVEILEQRCDVPKSYCQRLVGVMHELQMRRRESGVFAGKQGFITLRDLFRWGERYNKMEAPPEGLDWLQHMAYEGYLLLAGRVRLPEEMTLIKDVIQKHLGKKIDPDLLFTLSKNTPAATRDILAKAMHSTLTDKFKNVVWTYSMRRLAVQVGKAIQFNEPVLLIGITGSGKTTICQMFSELFRKNLHSVNCHMHSESADFLGGLRPVRDPELRETKLFEWVDGPLIQAMQEGSLFLCDEISLADDSVLERLNSILEPDQKILVAEKSFDSSDQLEITAKEGFHFFATMNPGGDYGKKELSPALRNRFTEIWCPSTMNVASDVIAIVEHNISKNLRFKKYASVNASGFGQAIADFIDVYSKTDVGRRVTLSIRDILTWVEFINLSQGRSFKGRMSTEEAYIHGAFLVFLDGIGSGSASVNNEKNLLSITRECFKFLKWQIEDSRINFVELMAPELYNEQFENLAFDAYDANKSHFGIGPFFIKCGPAANEEWCDQYVLESKTPKANVLRVLRAMQLSKPILLEGSPGVGKTSLISILAKATGHKLVRINLSEQTDISDLFGADLPVDGGEKGAFAWRNGPLLQALNNGDWILLDELNLASQSVLEGLNACLDHRNEIFIPELGMTFHLNKTISRIFCCQNPQRQGGSRKGLPQSFLNRFSQVYMRPMERGDMEYIASSMYSTVPPGLISAMILFNNEMSNKVNVERKFGHSGSPWEFNLRDVFRWCDAIIDNQNDSEYNIGEYMKLIYMDRMRTPEDKKITFRLYENVIKTCGLGAEQMDMNRNLNLNVFEQSVQLGYSLLPCKGANRSDSKMICIPPAQLPYLESLMKCIEMKWMAILVGPSGSGKSTLVRSLAELCGQELHILSVNSEMDTIELLGGFEQADMNRKIEYLAQEIQPILEKAIFKCLQSTTKVKDQKRHLKELLCHLINVRQCIYSGSSLQEDNCFKKLNCLKYLIKAIEPLKIESCRSVLASCKNKIENLIKRTSSRESFNGGKFEWVDSVLIIAAQRGHWLLIDDANFCSSSVLDRLNALLEPGGVLTINEQGIVNNELRTIKPHPDFRIILTMNPQHGEISRAMRNRGIEIYIEPATPLMRTTNNDLLPASIFAQCKGLVHDKILLHSVALFQRLSRNPELESPSLSDFISCAALCVQISHKFVAPNLAFQESALAVYGGNYLNASSREIAFEEIMVEVGKMKNILKRDFSIPLTDLLPSSIDYRQNPVFASLKKHACLFTAFLKDFHGKSINAAPFPEDIEGYSHLSVVPSLPVSLSEHIHINVKTFIIIIRMMFEASSLQNFKLIDAWVQFLIKSFTETCSVLPDSVKTVCSLILQYKEKIKTITKEPIMETLANNLMDICNVTDFSEIAVKEMPFDLRWNKYVYERVMIQLKKKSEEADCLEYNYHCNANRFYLHLLFLHSNFYNDILALHLNEGEKNLKMTAEDVIKNPDKYEDSPLLTLRYVPEFNKAVSDLIFKFLGDSTIPFNDENFSKVYEVILSYNFICRIYLYSSTRGPESQLIFLSLHISWLMKKLHNLYDGDYSLPPSLTIAETAFSFNNPTLKFRHKFVKWIGRPSVFADDKSAELCRLVEENYKHLDLAERLKSYNIKLQDLKSIRANLEWHRILCNGTFNSIYEKVHKTSPDEIADIRDVKNQMIDIGLLDIEDDEIVEMSKTPVKNPTMSDLELALDIQLLPLWDYVCIMYEVKVVSNACSMGEQSCFCLDMKLEKSLLEVFVQIGSKLALNPKHTAHLVALQQIQSKQSLAPSMFYFLLHSRHGFSSDALSALEFEIKDKSIVNKSHVNKHWNSDYLWAKQQPLLTHIFSSIFGKSCDSPLMCHFPLGTYSEKIGQLKKAQTILWKHYDRLADRNKSFRYHSASIVISWYNNLLFAIGEMGKLSVDETKIEDVVNFFRKSELTPLITTDRGYNVLILANETVVQLQEKLIQDPSDPNLQNAAGKAYILVGLLTSMLLLPRDYVEPAMKGKAKCLAFHEDINNIEGEKEMKKWIHKITTGYSIFDEWIPENPCIGIIEHLCSMYKKKLIDTEQKLPFRGIHERFASLKADVRHCMKTILSPDEILDIVSKFDYINEHKVVEDMKIFAAYQKALTFSKNLQSFVAKVLEKYALYPDITLPFLLGVEQIIFGLSMSSHSLPVKEGMASNNPQKLNHINEFLEQFCQFSPGKWNSSLHMASTVLNSTTLSNFKVILSFCKDSLPNRGRLLYKLIKSAILELINEIKIGSYQTESKKVELKQLLFFAFQFLYDAFRVQDERAKEKMAEEEKLFTQKTYETELSDEDKIIKDLKEMFPSYEEDFDAVIQSSEDQRRKKRSVSTQVDDDDSIELSSEDMLEICQLHATVISLLGDNSEDNSNLYIKQSSKLDFLTPFLLRHEVVSSIVTSLGDSLDSSFDQNLIEGQLLQSQELQKLKGLEDDEFYDIYHDPNPFKVVTINPLLLKLVKHINDLLKEFPENPNLIQILTVTQRVLSFPVSEPLMKFVVGLELILEATQIWEQNAHSKVSIKAEMDELTKSVIEFRSMELNAWKKGLQCVIRKQFLKCSKWWFFMFPLFYCDNTYTESEKLLIVQGLTQCLQDSPIGEFRAKLSLLRVFLKEFQLNTSKSNRAYASILFNIYEYFKQFLPAIENEIKQIRKPIEKEIKDFVKIARWNDINFYSVKASVEKSHRFILKHVKAFEDALRKPSKTYFVIPSKSDSDVIDSPWSLDIKQQDFIYEQTKVRTKCFKERNEPFFQKFPSFQKKIKRKSRQIAETFPVVGYINTLNEFCGNIIEALQSATAEGRKSVCTRSREKKQTLLKIQNKKQMLSTLFKNLKAIGLSYRQGIIKHKEVSVHMCTPALDISQMKILKTDHSFKKLLLKSSCDTNHYFYKSLAQYAQLQTAMESPSKDLTLDVIHRVQGYGGHLLNLVISQREKLTKITRDVDNFGCFVSVLSNVYEKQDYAAEKCLTVIPPQEFFHQSDVEMHNLMEILLLAAGQFNSLLECAPESNIFTKQHSLCFNHKGLSGVIKDDSFFSGIKHALDVFNCDIKNLLLKLSELNFGETLVSWDHLNTFSSLSQQVQHSTHNLIMKISEKCESKSPMTQNLFSLSGRVSQKLNVCKVEEARIVGNQMVDEPTKENEQSIAFSKLCQKLAKEVLLAIQEMVVFSASGEEDKSETTVVPEHLFTGKISDFLSETKKHLHFDKILKITQRLKANVSYFQNSIESLLPIDRSFRLLVNLVPLLNQYYQLVKVYLAITIGMHRTSCKFLSIILEIFNILAQKGFCIPPELQEEASKAEGTKFEDIESGGLGEGEGTRDVSGNIETEDQLEDALKEGQEKKDEEPKDKDLKDEEQGIEMSNDFEGKAHSADEAENSGEDENEEGSEELEKHMGDVEDDAEKLDDKVWGSDSENEDDLRDEDGTGGVTDNAPSELAAKDNKYKEDGDENKDKGKEQPQEVPLDSNDEYSGEKPDPMINAPPMPEPEVEELPENMEITDDVDKGGPDENLEEMEDPSEKLDDSEDQPGEEETEGEDGGKENGTDQTQEDADGDDDMKAKSMADQNEAEPMDELDTTKDDECNLPTKTPTAEIQALPSDAKTSSSDPVQSNEAMDWETGAQNSKEQHKEGLAETTSMPSEDPGHEGMKSSAKARELAEKPYNPKLKPPGEKRTLDEASEEQDAKRRHITDKKNFDKPHDSSQDNDSTAEMYEHVSKEEEGTTQAIDIATKEQADMRAVQSQYSDEDEEEIIELSSDDESDEICNQAIGESLKTSQNQKPGDRGDMGENENIDIPDGEIVIVETQTASRGAESTIHTQTELWKSLGSAKFQSNRLKKLSNVNLLSSDDKQFSTDELWRLYEQQVASLSRELCEQLRLVLEPTKMSKFKGDFRTGKRLNMRKIIPYIASQFRKDKIWLRRTKPTKRQYQIMLAVDDSSSMADNNSKQLAFESLAVLGQSLTLLEAGELSVVSFGENVQLLHCFQDQFSSSAGARILEQFTFCQKKTRITQLLNYATDTMLQARNTSRSAASKETAQLLIVISDGRGIYSEGENAVKNAVRNARNNNVFMVFLILDNPDSKISILDIESTSFEGKEVKRKSYMDNFPFPFYIILREISALPQVLGEALRQWFELVTSVDR